MNHHNVGDLGQRYEVSFYDPNQNKRIVFGWSETIEGAIKFENAIKAHPVWVDPQTIDRNKKPNDRVEGRGDED